MTATATAEACMALQMLSYRTLEALVHKGVLLPNEAAGLAVHAAEEMRTLSEGEPNQAPAEAAARGLETVAGWLLQGGMGK